jgi:hypothetical protein
MEETNNLMLSDKMYDAMKKLVQIVLPAFATFYFTMAAIWNLPNSENVVGTIAAITTLLGVILGISSRKYVAPYDGVAVVTQEAGGVTRYSLELTGDDAFNTFSEKSSITFKIRTE